MAVDYYVDGDKQRIDPDLLCGRAEVAQSNHREDGPRTRSTRSCAISTIKF